MNLFPDLKRRYASEPLSAREAQRQAEFIAWGPVVFQVSRLMVKFGILELLRDSKEGLTEAEALSRFHLNGFNSLMILDKEQCRPFDKNRAGLNLGEGAAFVVLTHESVKSEELRVKNNRNIFECNGNSDSSLFTLHSSLYIRGYANRCDAFHQTASSASGEGAFLAMSEALQMAGLEPKDIQYINAHGTGTPNNDASESAAIRRIFSTHRGGLPPVSSTKGFTGHTTSASGAIETVICILAILNDFIPANIGWKEQDEECVTPCVGSEERRVNSSLNNVLCNSFGFGGNDSAIVISRKPHPQPLSGKRGVKQPGEASILSPSGELEGVSVREFLSPGEARRMGKLLKAAIITSLKALKEAGIETPDAIITATEYGMLETSDKFLIDMLENGEETLSPTRFMQSTHNTISSAIAIRTKCRGYNMTYSQGRDSFQWALRDARRLIETGKAKTVLVGCHGESTPTFQEFFRRMGKPVPPLLSSRSIVLAAADD